MRNPFLDDDEEETPPVPQGEPALGTGTASVAGRPPTRLVLGKTLKLSASNAGGPQGQDGGQPSKPPSTLTLKLGRRGEHAGEATGKPQRPLVLTKTSAAATTTSDPTRSNGSGSTSPLFSLRHRPVSTLAVTGWWAFFCNCDDTRRFSDDPFFHDRLAPLAEAPATVFYATMNTLFEQWRGRDWGPVVLGQADVFRQKPNSSATPPLTRERIFEQGRRAVVAACARWTESLRVQRLVAQHILLSLQDDTESDEADELIEEKGPAADEEEESRGEGTRGRERRRKQVFRFEEACPVAVLAATTNTNTTTTTTTPSMTGLLPDDGPRVGSLPSHICRRPRGNNSVGEADLYLLPTAPTRYDDDAPENGQGGTREHQEGEEEGREWGTGGAPMWLATVPTRMRVLLLLRVLDAVWQEPCSSSFRMPVTEWEAPGYHKRIREPVSLLALYEDVFRGCPAKALAGGGGSSTKGVDEHASVLTAAGAGAGAGAKPWRKGVFMDYAAVKERLVLLRTNSHTYNGDGSALAQLAAELTSAGVKAIRDAQAEEEDQIKDLALLRHTQRAGRGVVVGDAVHGTGVGRTPVLAPLTLAELKEAFPPTAFPGTTAAEADPPATSGKARERTERDEAAEGREGEGPLRPRRRGRKPKVEKGAATGAEATKGDDSDLTAPKRRGRRRKSEVAATADDSRDSAAHEKAFWICCDRCGEWRRLPRKINPLPSYWECVYMGQTCNPQGIAARAGTENGGEEGRKRQATATGAATIASRVKIRREKQPKDRRSFADLYAGLVKQDSSSSSSSSSTSSSSSSDSDSSSSSSSSSSSEGSGHSRKRKMRRTRGQRDVASAAKKKKKDKSVRRKSARDGSDSDSDRGQRPAVRVAPGKGGKRKAPRAPLTANELVLLEEQMAILEAQPISEDPLDLLKQLKAIESRLP